MLVTIIYTGKGGHKMASLAVHATLARIFGKDKPLGLTRADVERMVKEAGEGGYLMVTLHGYMQYNIPFGLITGVEDDHFTVSAAYLGTPGCSCHNPDQDNTFRFGEITECKPFNFDWLKEE